MPTIDVTPPWLQGLAAAAQTIGSIEEAKEKKKRAEAIEKERAQRMRLEAERAQREREAFELDKSLAELSEGRAAKTFEQQQAALAERAEVARRGTTGIAEVLSGIGVDISRPDRQERIRELESTVAGMQDPEAISRLLEQTIQLETVRGDNELREGLLENLERYRQSGELELIEGQSSSETQQLIDRWGDELLGKRRPAREIQQEITARLNRVVSEQADMATRQSVVAEWTPAIQMMPGFVRASANAILYGYMKRQIPYEDMVKELTSIQSTGMTIEEKQRRDRNDYAMSVMENYGPEAVAPALREYDKRMGVEGGGMPQIDIGALFQDAEGSAKIRPRTMELFKKSREAREAEDRPFDEAEIAEAQERLLQIEQSIQATQKALDERQRMLEAEPGKLETVRGPRGMGSVQRRKKGATARERSLAKDIERAKARIEELEKEKEALNRRLSEPPIEPPLQF